MIHPYEPLAFAACPLDRVDAKRRDPEWVAAHLAEPRSRFVPVWRNKAFLSGMAERAAEAVVLDGAGLTPAMRAWPWALLGLRSGQAYFALDASGADEPGLPGTQEDLFRIAHHLDQQDAAILAYARGLMHWRARHRHCSVCGAACTPHNAGHTLHCEGCGAHHFPRTDPAVIMLVTHGDRILLGQPVRIRDRRIFTTLAGFVEPGESLEEAVAREVFEEAGIRVANVRYCSSQPWPFPASIMLGFSAEAVTTDITIDPHELVEAGWFSRADLRNPADFMLPPAVSIARRLIDDWFKEQE